MVDIQSTQPPTAATLSSSTPAAPTSTTGLTPIQVTIANVSQALEDLTRAIQTGATPIAPPDGNSLTLATALGNITISLPQLTASEQQTLIQQLTLFAQTQRPLTLAMQPGSPPTQAVLLIPTSNAQPTLPQTPLPLPQTSSSVPLSSLPTLPLVTGETFPAIVLPPLSPQATPLAPVFATTISQPLVPENMPNNSPLNALPTTPSVSQTPASATLSAQNVPLPTPSLQSPASLAPQSAPTAMPQSLPLNAFQPAVSPLTNLLQPGNEVSLRVSTVILPQAQASQAPLPALAPNQIAATVVGTGTNGQLILKAGDTTLFVKAQVTAPIGTTVILTVETAKAPPLLTLPSFDPVNFPALPQITAALVQIDPQALQQMMAMRIPQPTDNLSGALLFLFSAFKQGNTRNWLGDEPSDRLMQAGKESLLASISHELNESGQPTQDGTVGEWRSYPIPLFTQQQFQALTLYVHNEQKDQQGRESGKSSGTGKVRFLIDMRLSKLGAMQIDGFVQPKKLDMILRSEHLLPDGMHNDLRLSYIKALGAVGYTGALNFQVGRQHWMRMQRSGTQAVMM